MPVPGKCIGADDEKPDLSVAQRGRHRGEVGVHFGSGPRSDIAPASAAKPAPRFPAGSSRPKPAVRRPPRCAIETTASPAVPGGRICGRAHASSSRGSAETAERRKLAEARRRRNVTWRPSVACTPRAEGAGVSELARIAGRGPPAPPAAAVPLPRPAGRGEWPSRSSARGSPRVHPRRQEGKSSGRVEAQSRPGKTREIPKGGPPERAEKVAARGRGPRSAAACSGVRRRRPRGPGGVHRRTRPGPNGRTRAP